MIILNYFLFIFLCCNDFYLSVCSFFLLQDTQQSVVCIESSANSTFNRDEGVGVCAELPVSVVESTFSKRNKTENSLDDINTNYVGMKKDPLLRKKRKIESVNTQHSQKNFLVALEDFEDLEIQEIDELEVFMN